MLRTLRLIKLLKLVSGSRLWQRYQMEHSINYGMLNIFGAVVKVILFAHWVACLWGLQASIYDDLSKTWVGVDYGCLPEHEDFEECFGDAGYARPYLRALYFAVTTITSVGYGDVTANPSNSLEIFVCTLIILSSSFLWAVTLGTVIGELTSFDADRAAFRMKIDALNTFMHKK